MSSASPWRQLRSDGRPLWLAAQTVEQRIEREGRRQVAARGQPLQSRERRGVLAQGGFQLGEGRTGRRAIHLDARSPGRSLGAAPGPTNVVGRGIGTTREVGHWKGFTSR